MSYTSVTNEAKLESMSANLTILQKKKELIRGTWKEIGSLDRNWTTEYVNKNQRTKKMNI